MTGGGQHDDPDARASRGFGLQRTTRDGQPAAVTSSLGSSTAIRVLGHIASRVATGRWEVPGTGAHLVTARAVTQRYPDLKIGPTDAMNAVLAKNLAPATC
ncbi:hypothetical protein [Streptomyces oceani]|uniref:hypothetical protein n=1 Tax=Streptomyces oceani TaxID=1075402 RepID=UPI001112D8EF|nr:hypothetical protein [Streptomyces oceani]